MKILYDGSIYSIQVTGGINRYFANVSNRLPDDLIPSLIVAIFSLFIFNFGVQNYFDKHITKAVNNSFDVA